MKQIISLITAVILGWHIAAGTVITAAAEKANEREYVYSGYTVLYTVTSEWTGYQSVEVKLTNTGEESLYGWGLKYDAGGTIDNIWNAKILSRNGIYCEGRELRADSRARKKRVLRICIVM